MIPNIVHFIFGVTDDPAGRQFTFLSYLAVATAWAVHKPERIFLHYQYEPVGPWWTKARRYLTPNRIEAPDHIFGNPVEHPAHKADVIRLEQLYARGGIYLDLDVISIRDLTPLREDNAVVLGREFKRGLCNAVILAAPQAQFIERWRAEYRDFNAAQWSEHSIKRPWQLANEYGAQVSVVDQDLFYFPMYNDPPHVLWMSRRAAWRLPSVRAQIIERVGKHVSRAVRFKPLKGFNPPLARLLRSEASHFRQLQQSYCIHLWNQLWWQPYLRHIRPETIAQNNNNFSKIVRHVLADTHVLSEMRDSNDT